MKDENKPLISGRSNKVLQYAVWNNQTKNGSFQTLSLKRSYYDRKAGKWKKTNIFRLADIPFLIKMLQETQVKLSKLKNNGELT